MRRTVWLVLIIVWLVASCTIHLVTVQVEPRERMAASQPTTQSTFLEKLITDLNDGG